MEQSIDGSRVCQLCGKHLGSHSLGFFCWDMARGEWSKTRKFIPVDLPRENRPENKHLAKLAEWPDLIGAGTPPPPQALFAQRAGATIKRCCAIFDQRGNQYGDTWKDCQFLALKAVCRQLGIKLDDKHCRAVALATFVDVKYIRLLGGYHDDSLVDGINYTAALAEEMEQLK